MTVAANNSNNTYSGNGSNKIFNFTFRILDEDQLSVSVTDEDGIVTVKSIGGDYIVTGTGNQSGLTDYVSGNVTFVTAPLATDKVSLVRNIPLDQDVNYVENKPFPVETHERALDKLTMLMQEAFEVLGRSLKSSVSQSTFNSVFPKLIANYFIRVNANATAFEMTEGTGAVSVGYVADLDTVAVTGFYYTDSSTAGRPNGKLGTLQHFVVDGNTATQDFVAVDTTHKYFRRKTGGVWQAWREIQHGSI